MASPRFYKSIRNNDVGRAMQGKKAVGTWSIDIKVKAWIDTKIANKSQFVNRILKDAYISEVVAQAKKEMRPKCPVCRTSMRLGDEAGGESEWVCSHLYCDGVIE